MKRTRKEKVEGGWGKGQFKRWIDFHKYTCKQLQRPDSKSQEHNTWIHMHTFHSIASPCGPRRNKCSINLIFSLSVAQDQYTKLSTTNACKVRPLKLTHQVVTRWLFRIDWTLNSSTSESLKSTSMSVSVVETRLKPDFSGSSSKRLRSNVSLLEQNLLRRELNFAPSGCRNERTAITATMTTSESIDIIDDRDQKDSSVGIVEITSAAAIAALSWGKKSVSNFQILLRPISTVNTWEQSLLETTSWSCASCERE